MALGNKTKILVTFANIYDMPAEVGRDSMKGCSVEYYFYGEAGEALAPTISEDMTQPQGYRRSKVSMNYEKRAEIPVCPCICEGTFTMVTGSDGKPVMKLVDIEYVEPFDIAELVRIKDETAKKTAEAPKAGAGK